ncbi:hypothetical protein PCE1_001532 [Barthelona sp. PCE]
MNTRVSVFVGQSSGNRDSRGVFKGYFERVVHLSLFFSDSSFFEQFFFIYGKQSFGLPGESLGLLNLLDDIPQFENFLLGSFKTQSTVFLIMFGCLGTTVQAVRDIILSSKSSITVFIAQMPGDELIEDFIDRNAAVDEVERYGRACHVISSVDHFETLFRSEMQRLLKRRIVFSMFNTELKLKADLYPIILPQPPIKKVCMCCNRESTAVCQKSLSRTRTTDSMAIGHIICRPLKLSDKLVMVEKIPKTAVTLEVLTAPYYYVKSLLQDLDVDEMITNVSFAESLRQELSNDNCIITSNAEYPDETFLLYGTEDGTIVLAAMVDISSCFPVVEVQSSMVDANERFSELLQTLPSASDLSLRNRWNSAFLEAQSSLSHAPLHSVRVSSRPNLFELVK